MEALLASYCATDMWDAMEVPVRRHGTEMLLVTAAKSVRWKSDEAIRRRRKLEDGSLVDVETVPKSGHWIHVDAPDALLDILEPRFARAEARA